MDLSGPWRAAPAREELRRTFHEPALDDRAWPVVTVPGHWAHTEGLANERAVLHRRRFSMAPLEDEQRRWLLIDGIAQQGDVWLDGAYVGDTDGYFVPHRFEVTHLMGETEDHLLAVDVTVPSFGDPDERTDLMGAILDPELSGTAGRNPGGIWRTVSLYDTGMTAIRHFRVVCADANPARARLAMRCVFDHPDGGPVVFRTRVAATEHEIRHTAAVGENRVEWTIDVPDPDLWWPHALGDPTMHDLTCTLEVDGTVHDKRSVRTGFRSVKLDGWKLVVNDEQLFCKGIAVLPTTPRPGDASDREVRADVEAARTLGFDLLRTVAYVAHPHLYEAADDLGMLVWQEMPLRGVMARSVRGQAVRQAREMVDLLAHHPSVAVWCPHDEPFRRPATPPVTPPVVGQQRPSWNRAVLDSSVRRVLQRTDGSRPIVVHTAVPPHLPQLDGTTSHLWFGWHGQRVDDLGPALARVPRMGRFVTAFGAATIDPELPELRSPRWPALDWDALAAAVGTVPSALHHLVPPARISDGPTWARVGALAQAELLKRTIETLRRLKYRPTGGFCAFFLADPSAVGGFGVLDHERRTKPAWQAVAQACRPVIVTADLPPPGSTGGRPIHAAIHVVSDRRDDLAGVQVRATVTHPDGSRNARRWVGDIGADTVERVATLPVDHDGSGSVTLDLELAATGADGPVTATNRYEIAIG